MNCVKEKGNRLVNQFYLFCNKKSIILGEIIHSLGMFNECLDDYCELIFLAALAKLLFPSMPTKYFQMELSHFPRTQIIIIYLTEAFGGPSE